MVEFALLQMLLMCGPHFRSDVIVQPIYFAEVQSDVDKLTQWEASWLMAFHPEKCSNYYKEKKSIKVQLHSPRTFT
jgi:hypothetical protein